MTPWAELDGERALPSTAHGEGGRGLGRELSPGEGTAMLRSGEGAMQRELP